jgi:hypothetical protein
MGIAPGDYDRNGVADVFVTNSRDQGHGVFRDIGTAEFAPRYEDDAESFGQLDGYTGWGVSWLDFDLDTDLDLLVTNGDIPLTDLAEDAMPLQLFRNVGEPVNRFENVSGELGVDAVGWIHGRGSAAADFDNDGDLDVAVNAIAGRLVLLENRGATGNWLEVDIGVSDPGTVVLVTLSDGGKLIRQSVAGSSYLSSEDPRLHFGLGSAESVREVIVVWPGGAETQFTEVAVNQILEAEPPRG